MQCPHPLEHLRSRREDVKIYVASVDGISGNVIIFQSRGCMDNLFRYMLQFQAA